MADLSDVETALVSLVAAAMYPAGAAEASAAGIDCRVYRGWPVPAALNADLRAGIVNVTAFPGTDPGQVTTRHGDEWSGEPPTPGLTFTISGKTVSFGGSAMPGQAAGLLIDGRSYVYRTQMGDTPASVTANLAELARTDGVVQLAGAALTVPGAGNVAARVVADAVSRKEVRRQTRTFHVACWCPTPASRDRVATVIDLALAAVRFLDLADGSSGRMTYEGTVVTDRSEEALLYRRDLLFAVEYPTIVTATQPAMLFGDLVLNAAERVA